MGGLLGHLIPEGLKEIRRKHERERGKKGGERRREVSVREREREKEKEIEKAGMEF